MSRTACLLLSLSVAAAAGGAQLRVPEDHATPEAALAAAEAGDEILIGVGEWAVALRIDKAVTLRGVETARSRLRAADADAPVIDIGAARGVTVRNLHLAAGAVGVRIDGGEDVEIHNNVFALGGSATAVEVLHGTDIVIRRNTFVGNRRAVRSSVPVSLTANLFSGNETPIVSEVVFEALRENCFDTDQEPQGDEAVQGAIEFADAERGDHHLTAESACVDTAAGSDLAGAWSGAEADAKPFPPQDVVLEPTAAGDGPAGAALRLVWSPNRWHRVDGYRVDYGRSASYGGDEALDAEGNPLPSPVELPVETHEWILYGLPTAAEPPPAPELAPPEPGNGRLTLRWSAVAGASGYRLYWGRESVEENRLDLGPVTEHRLTGLENGAAYLVEVRALAQLRYHAAVAARAAGVLGDATAVGPVAVGEAVEGPPSNRVSGLPEPVRPYPDLPAQGDVRCFVATAVYGDADAPQVVALRTLRDRWLRRHALGRRFIAWYYAQGPSWAAWVRRHPWLRPLLRAMLAPVATLAAALPEPPSKGSPTPP